MNFKKDDERIYPCVECGVMRSKNEGGTTFTVCDKCWDKNHPPKAKPSDRLLSEQKICKLCKEESSCDKDGFCEWRNGEATRLISAQLAKTDEEWVKWGEEDCTHSAWTEKRKCFHCWQERKKEIGQ